MSERNKLDEALQRAARAACGLPSDAEPAIGISVAAAAISEALDSLAADGWVLVPREATTEMFYAWVRNTPGGSEYVDGEPTFTSGWRAALAAAPKVVP